MLPLPLPHEQQPYAACRRALLGTALSTAVGLLVAPCDASAAAAADFAGNGIASADGAISDAPALPAASVSGQSCAADLSQLQLLDYAGPGPFSVVELPRMEHLCTSLGARCVAAQCMLRVTVTCAYHNIVYFACLPARLPACLMRWAFLFSSGPQCNRAIYIALCVELLCNHVTVTRFNALATSSRMLQVPTWRGRIWLRPAIPLGHLLTGLPRAQRPVPVVRGAPVVLGLRGCEVRVIVLHGGRNRVPLL